MFISKGNSVLFNCMLFFFLLSIANLGSEITLEATKNDLKEFWYAFTLVGYFSVKMYKKK